IHPIQFAAIIGSNLGMGMMTPPMAGILYIGARTGNVTIDKMMKPAMILILFCSIPVILVTTFWPPLSLFIPTLLGYVH
ncbi:MAG: TRAP transporter large permease subunit, partial [Thermovirgaceae bacterium]|nr:TRAP transporter large permease subunit [Thermovirgaceae bacterium]